MKSATKISKMHARVNAAKEDRIDLGDTSNIKIAENTFWDDANETHKVITEGIAKSYSELASVVQSIVADPERLAAVKEPMLLAENIKLVTRDVGDHIDRINRIHDEHKDKTGGTTDPDDHIRVLQINGQYADAMEIYQTVVMPSVSHIFEQIGGAEEVLMRKQMQAMLEEKLAQEAAQVALTDVNVVSDVQVKEIKE